MNEAAGDIWVTGLPSVYSDSSQARMDAAADSPHSRGRWGLKKTNFSISEVHLFIKRHSKEVCTIFTWGVLSNVLSE